MDQVLHLLRRLPGLDRRPALWRPRAAPPGLRPARAAARAGGGPAWLSALPVVLSLSFSAAFIVRSAFRVGETTYFSLFDDAMVSMQYARNLADGHGLVWNAGQPAVEGYSNTLWTLWMALIHLTGLPDSLTSLAVMITGALLLAANVALVWLITERLAPGDRAAALAASLLTALFFPLVFWALRGMEVGLMATATLGAVLLALRFAQSGQRRDAYVLAGILAIGLLVRDDFVVVATAVIGWTGFATRGCDRRALAVLVSVPVCVVAAHAAFRLAYYGYPLPNTYYLKLAGVGLDIRVARGARMLVEVSAVSLYLPLALGALALLGGAVMRRGALLAAAVLVSQAAYVVYVGGDAWEGLGFADRYVAQVAPLLLVLAVLGLRTLLRAPPHMMLRMGLAVSAVLALLFAVTESPATSWWFEYMTPGLGPRHLVPPYPFLALWFLALGAAARRRRSQSSRGVGGRLAPYGLVWGLSVVMILVAVSGAELGAWVKRNAPHVRDDAAMARYGLLLRELTSPQASVAVVWAGALPYFSQRPAVDLLGKTDPVIAHGPSHPIPFIPGHSKWDYAHSITRLRPDLIAQEWIRGVPQLRQAAGRAGYEPWMVRDVPGSLRGGRADFATNLASLASGRVLVRRGTERVDRSRLHRAGVLSDRDTRDPRQLGPLRLPR